MDPRDSELPCLLMCVWYRTVYLDNKVSFKFLFYWKIPIFVKEATLLILLD